MSAALLLLYAGISPAFVHGALSGCMGIVLSLFVLLPVEKIRFPRLLHKLLLFLIFTHSLLNCGHFAALLLPWHRAKETGIALALLFTALFRRNTACLLLPLLPLLAAFVCLALQPIHVSPVPSPLPFPDTLISLFLLFSMKKTLPGKTCPQAACMLFLFYALQALALPVPLLQRMRALAQPGHGISCVLCFCACLLRCCAAWHSQSALGAAAAAGEAPAAAAHPPGHTGA